ncbi:hypothetical protein THIOM_005370 [Candidatus Thiomargarita nelsonii]|uniref:RiboL-PSP-HEPN domain-containing protein n=1 Tax=Candidatus Thiomargarita nelsonii TaxID=1003181 RepID=A0A176RTF0_9GAMM|nr:hypothetical protein THIOM_005370 [Candidatus Thiomargarita nelsonii]
MNKLRTISDIQNHLNDELGWRIQEIDNLKKLIPRVNSIQARSLLRAGIPILYAHWEGFVKSSSEAYLNFVAHQGLSYRELKTCFILFGLKTEIEQLVETNKITPNIQVANFFLDKLDKKAKIFYKGVINTQSNLSSLVFEEIASSIGINPDSYKFKYKLIDESLLKRRNQIAHGEYLDIDTQGYQNLSDEVVALIRNYKIDIENSIALESYKSSL